MWRNIALGLRLRMDWGTRCTAQQLLGALALLGVGPTPSHMGKLEAGDAVRVFEVVESSRATMEVQGLTGWVYCSAVAPRGGAFSDE